MRAEAMKELKAMLDFTSVGIGGDDSWRVEAYDQVCVCS
jgi:hypothetical protein